MSRKTCIVAIVWGGCFAFIGCTGAVSPPGTGNDARPSDAVVGQNDATRPYEGSVTTHDGPAIPHDTLAIPHDTPIGGLDQSHADLSPINPCQGVTCSGQGTCSVDPTSHQATCICDRFYLAQGLNCVYACDTITCDVDKTCVPEHHGQTDPMCMPLCDCSNCGNCSMQDFSIAGTQVLYCGNPGGNTPTSTCTKPCPSGWGCLPYSPSFCWPGQGCLSQ